MAEEQNSALTEVFDELVDSAQDFLTEQLKNEFISWLQQTGLPKFKELTDAYCEQLKLEAEAESGWNKFRDKFFVPLVISAAYWVVEKMIKKMLDADSEEAAE